MKADETAPFLKWPGGKRWASRMIAGMIGKRLRGTYYEPFLGGGAVFFQLRPDQPVLSDINSDLINTYMLVRDRPAELISRLRRLSVDKQTYDHMRETEPDDNLMRAVRFLYLNRTAFSGIYRLNLQGRFNVPFGGGERTHKILWEKSLLRNASRALEGADIRHEDFETMLDSAQDGDVVYCDPTYTVAHDNNGFVRYNERNFSWADQIRLAAAAMRASGRGALVIVSNAKHSSVCELYDGANIQVLTRNSTVSTDIAKRQAVKELLICL
jgi:DNA adenine methylase